MKQILSAIIIVGLLISTGLCDEYVIDAQSKEKVQLDVSIRFNAIKPGLALKIMNHLRELYGLNGITKEACKLEYKISSPDTNITGTVTYGDGTTEQFTYTYELPLPQGGKPYTSFGDPCYDSEKDAEAHCDDGYNDSHDSDGFRYCCN